MPRKPQYDNLREACIDEAINIITSDGIDNLSLRQVSRRLGVSHQAPYKHFPSRDHILAEVVSRMYQTFAEHMGSVPTSDDPYADLRGMGRAYLGYAVDHPLEYQLMFNTPLPPAKDHPDMMTNAQKAFGLVRDCLDRMGHPKPMQTALFVWATMHGWASLLQAQVLDTVALPDDLIESATEHILDQIRLALTNTNRA